MATELLDWVAENNLDIAAVDEYMAADDLSRELNVSQKALRRELNHVKIRSGSYFARSALVAWINREEWSAPEWLPMWLTVVPDLGDRRRLAATGESPEHIISSLVKCITPRENLVLEQLNSFLKLEIVGMEWNLSRERIKQIEYKSLRKLRREIYGRETPVIPWLVDSRREEIITISDAAKILNRSGQTLCLWRSRGQGMRKYRKLGQYYFYSRSDVIEWESRAGSDRRGYVHRAKK